MFGFTMSMPLIAVAWAAAAPGTMSSLTLLMLVVVGIGTAAVIFNTWRAHQPLSRYNPSPDPGDRTRMPPRVS